jgi:hypothetical protein
MESRFLMTTTEADKDMDSARAHPRPALHGAHTEGEPAGAWRPIDTATKGGGAERIDDPAWVNPPEILLLFEGGEQCVGRWDLYYAEGGDGAWETNGIGWIEALTLEPVIRHLSAPTHWMPLPDPPPAADRTNRMERG